MMVDPKLRYENMTLKELNAVINRCPLVIQPIGILEWHGNHNAVGMDGLTSQRICERVIARINDGVLMPTCWIGTYGYIHYPGTVCFDEETAYMVYKNMFSEYIKLGFKLIMLISGHGGKWQVHALERAKRDAITEQKSMIKENIELFGLVYPALTPGVSVLHAGDVETSMLWRIGQEYNVDLVESREILKGPERIPKYNLPHDASINFPETEEPETWEWTQDLANLNVCSPEKGESLLETFADGIYQEIQAWREDLGF